MIIYMDWTKLRNEKGRNYLPEILEFTFPMGSKIIELELNKLDDKLIAYAEIYMEGAEDAKYTIYVTTVGSPDFFDRREYKHYLGMFIFKGVRYFAYRK